MKKMHNIDNSMLFKIKLCKIIMTINSVFDENATKFAE